MRKLRDKARAFVKNAKKRRRCVRLQDLKEEALKKEPQVNLQELYDKIYGWNSWYYGRRPKIEEMKTFDSGYSFAFKLAAKKGYKFLGAGSYSIVLGKPGSDKVIKIGHRGEQDEWTKYVQWAKEKGYAGNLAPMTYKIKWVKPTKPNSGTFFIASMERMDKEWRDKVTSVDDMYLLPGLIEARASYKNNKAGELADIILPGANKFAIDLGEKFKRFDLHGKNIMFRKDGSVCFTDAVC